jgi:hypothetical protein
MTGSNTQIFNNKLIQNNTRSGLIDETVIDPNIFGGQRPNENLSSADQIPGAGIVK